MSRFTLPDPTHWCPGCNRTRCHCPPPWWEDQRYAEAYQRGFDAGAEEGLENRPSLAWLSSPLNTWREDDPEAYLAGYDDGAAGKPSAVIAEFERASTPTQETQTPDGDGLPF